MAFLVNKTNVSILVSGSKFQKKGSQSKAKNQLAKRMKELGTDKEVNSFENGAWVILGK